ncbi:transposase [Intrasporangium chromatireducens Q5-1]|uniref:Transposase n=1 Tax=Intrasporangium chromatireducens Q5-1 TaxID=584657 RepID=W9GQB1_9MICO|nr:transposase [Intrasporangium chromatireducens]EWT06034.1 transposase [Intrasporangium chromatireducens Q5-1]
MTMADLPTVDDVAVAARADRPKRRRFTQEYKDRILAEYEAAERGERGEILRREGLYTSHLVEWRRTSAGPGGQRAAAGGRVRKDPRDAQIEALTARASKAEAELARTRAALDLVGKAHALLETLSESADTPPRSTR